MRTAHIYRQHIDPEPTGETFWSEFGEIRTRIIKALLPYQPEWPFLRYVRGKHAGFEDILHVSQVPDLAALSIDRTVVERWERATRHEELSDSAISFVSAEFQELVLADVVCATALFNYEVDLEPYSFRLPHYIFPQDARFDLLRLMAIAKPDHLDRSELSSVHAGFQQTAEEWSC
ncbi:hypothetical protein PZ895_10560 [Mesorhizobium sp. YIM 152430]|uniref:hypothetical protein n=1 Tax=Mesorhizobium sp. YIM 152430 TaxID=3031761 RepID=UPI0023DB3DAC|nr:hypothetical protein [Mesorhizobium sp. YIM 152430]MDF1600213.1 hypothetical protein [Mesorhizobium sp. YIM 152430]